MSFGIDQSSSKKKVLAVLDAVAVECPWALWEVLHVASETLRDDFDVVLSAVSSNGYALFRASDGLKDNFDVVMAAVHSNGGALVHATTRLKADPDIVMEAVLSNGGALRHASKELQADYQTALVAVKTNGYAIEWASDKLKSNPVLQSWAKLCTPLERGKRKLHAAIQRRAIALFWWRRYGVRYEPRIGHIDQTHPLDKQRIIVMKMNKKICKRLDQKRPRRVSDACTAFVDYELSESDEDEVVLRLEPAAALEVQGFQATRKRAREEIARMTTPRPTPHWSQIMNMQRCEK
jgi:hypothetical protein